MIKHPILDDPNNPMSVFLSKLRGSVQDMLRKHHWPCFDEAGKEYACLVNPVNIDHLLWYIDYLKCQRDFLAREASRLAARMENIGLGHVNDNKFDWVKAAKEHCAKTLPEPKSHQQLHEHKHHHEPVPQHHDCHCHDHKPRRPLTDIGSMPPYNPDNNSDDQHGCQQ